MFPSEKYCTWIDLDRPIDAEVKAALSAFLLDLTPAHSLASKRHSLRNLLSTHLDGPVSRFLSGLGPIDLDHPPISRWGNEHDLNIDRTISRGVAPFVYDPNPADQRISATLSVLISLGIWLRTFKPKRSRSKKLDDGIESTAQPRRHPVRDFEYCQSCERYTERYQELLSFGSLLGFQVAVHPDLRGRLDAAGSNRFCSDCASPRARVERSRGGRLPTRSRPDLIFSHLVLEQGLIPKRKLARDFINPRNSEPLKTHMSCAWQHVQRKIAKFVSQIECNAGGEESLIQYIERLRSIRQAQQDFVVQLSRWMFDPIQPPPWEDVVGTDVHFLHAAVVSPGRETLVSANGQHADADYWAIDPTQHDPRLLWQRVAERLVGIRLQGRSRIWVDVPQLCMELTLRDPSAYRDSCSFLTCRIERDYFYSWIPDYLESERERRSIESSRETKSSERKWV